eukprot:RCo031075
MVGCMLPFCTAVTLALLLLWPLLSLTPSSPLSPHSSRGTLSAAHSFPPPPSILRRRSSTIPLPCPRPGVLVDPVSFQAGARPWPSDFSMHAEVAQVINALPCSADPLHQLPRDVRRLRVLYVLNCFDLSEFWLMLRALRAAAEMCEFGWSLLVVIQAAVEIDHALTH